MVIILDPLWVWVPVLFISMATELCLASPFVGRAWARFICSIASSILVSLKCRQYVEFFGDTCTDCSGESSNRFLFPIIKTSEQLGEIFGLEVCWFAVSLALFNSNASSSVKIGLEKPNTSLPLIWQKLSKGEVEERWTRLSLTFLKRKKNDNR